MDVIESEFTSEFHIIEKDNLEIGGVIPSSWDLEPFICPEEAMSAMKSKNDDTLATYDLSGYFTHQLSEVSQAEQFDSKTTLFVVGVSRGGSTPKESKVYKLFSDAKLAFAARDKANVDYQCYEIFVYDCKIVSKFKNLEDVAKVWELSA